MSLPPRKIGDALINPIGFGAMGLSSYYGSVDSDEERFKVSSLLSYADAWLRVVQILDAAYEKGCRHWDSSNLYGDSELLIGKWYVSICILKRTVRPTCMYSGSSEPVNETRFSLLPSSALHRLEVGAIQSTSKSNARNPLSALGSTTLTYTISTGE